jgi:8-oxo-dGTP diphosphatase
MQPEINKLYGNKIRVRISGLCWENNRLLLVNHRGLAAGDFWAPPGGGLEFGETVKTGLLREFREETGLRVSVGRFLFAGEFINDPLHAIELFFEVSSPSGSLAKGQDPELPIIEEVKFMSVPEIQNIPLSSLHGIFKLVRSPEQLKTLSGFFTI